MDDDRIDLSPLDPTRDARRWEALVQRALHPPETIWGSLTRLRAGVFALAAVAVLSWVPSLFVTPTTETDDAALALVQYAHNGDLTALLESTDGY